MTTKLIILLAIAFLDLAILAWLLIRAARYLRQQEQEEKQTINLYET